METREIKGMAILAKGDLPKELNKETFVVPSQSGAGNYQVSHVEGWTCSCPDFKYNGANTCKHIEATKFFLKLRNKTEVDDFPIEENIPEENNEEECPYCKSKEIVKNGARKTSAGTKQRYLCSACGKRFVLEPIKYVKANPKIVVLTLDLYYKGLSLRDISDTIFQFYNQRIHFDKIRRTWKSNKSIKTLANGHKIYHNFVHKHLTLGKTPAEQAGIKLELGNNKWLGLIKQSAGKKVA